MLLRDKPCLGFNKRLALDISQPLGPTPLVCAGAFAFAFDHWACWGRRQLGRSAARPPTLLRGAVLEYSNLVILEGRATEVAVPGAVASALLRIFQQCCNHVACCVLPYVSWTIAVLTTYGELDRAGRSKRVGVEADQPRIPVWTGDLASSRLALFGGVTHPM